MVTTPEEIEEPPTRLEQVREDVEAFTRIIIAGSPVGAVRRIVLYLVIGIALLPLATGGPAGIVVGGVGLIALLLLAMTDHLA